MAIGKLGTSSTSHTQRRTGQLRMVEENSLDDKAMRCLGRRFDYTAWEDKIPTKRWRCHRKAGLILRRVASNRTVVNNLRIERSTACASPDNKHDSSFHNNKCTLQVLAPDHRSSSYSSCRSYSLLFPLPCFPLSYLSQRLVSISFDDSDLPDDQGHLPLLTFPRLDGESETRHPEMRGCSSKRLCVKRC